MQDKHEFRGQAYTELREKWICEKWYAVLRGKKIFFTPIGPTRLS